MPKVEYLKHEIRAVLNSGHLQKPLLITKVMKATFLLSELFPIVNKKLKNILGK